MKLRRDYSLIKNNETNTRGVQPVVHMNGSAGSRPQEKYIPTIYTAWVDRLFFSQKEEARVHQHWCVWCALKISRNIPTEEWYFCLWFVKVPLKKNEKKKITFKKEEDVRRRIPIEEKPFLCEQAVSSCNWHYNIFWRGYDPCSPYLLIPL